MKFKPRCGVTEIWTWKDTNLLSSSRNCLAFTYNSRLKTYSFDKSSKFDTHPINEPSEIFASAAFHADVN